MNNKPLSSVGYSEAEKRANERRRKIAHIRHLDNAIAHREETIKTAMAELASLKAEREAMQYGESLAA